MKKYDFKLQSVPSCGVGQIWNSSASLTATKIFGIRMLWIMEISERIWKYIKIYEINVSRPPFFHWRNMKVTGTCAYMHQCTPILAKLQSPREQIWKKRRHVKTPRSWQPQVWQTLQDLGRPWCHDPPKRSPKGQVLERSRRKWWGAESRQISMRPGLVFVSVPGIWCVRCGVTDIK